MAQHESARAVTPVISLVLIVAIVVVLAAVVSVPVLEMGDGVDEPAPNVALTTEQTGENLTFIHQAGETIDPANLQFSGAANWTASNETIQAGETITVQPENGSDKIVVTWHEDRNSAILARASVAHLDDGTVNGTDPLAPYEEIPIVEIGDTPDRAQYDTLETVTLADPFTLVVKNEELAGEESTGYAVTAFYDGFDATPNDRLSGPSVPLAFDEDGYANVTIGNGSTAADVTTGIAPGPVSHDASLINTIEVPNGTDRIAVETD